ncbi:MAG: VCBS repeat-containing protein [Caulobacteraceae bacterium]|nr:VCBS repeat-containing protein [Caulobacteraceae bacterium]
MVDSFYIPGTDSAHYQAFGNNILASSLDRYVSALDSAGNLHLIDLTVRDETFTGTTGADSFAGGRGNDTYYVDNAGDTVTELPDQGHDKVISSIDYTLPDNVEDLTLSGTAVFGAGNSLNNVIVGDAADNVLDGGGGNDTLDGGSGVDTATYASAASAVSVGLAVAGAQDTGGAGVDTLVSIENLTGSAFNDTLAGNAGDNVLDGGGGVDTVSYAAAGAGVTVSLAVSGPQNTGGAGTDTLANFQNLTGSAFNDTLAGNAGDNVLDGGGGVDTVSYAAAGAGVTVSLGVSGPQNTGGSGTDTLANFENLTGSAFNDTLAGNAGDNVLDGGGGVDTVSYAAASAGVTVSLAISGPQNTGGAGTDTLANFEDLTGSAFNDTLAGDAGDNVLDGGGGVDTVSYAAAGAGVTVSLAVSGPQNTGGAGTDTLANFENLTGSAFNDTLAGNAGDNVLDGGGGVDTVSYAAASAGVTVSLAISGPQNTGAAGNDTLLNVENLTGSAFNDTLGGSAGDNVLDGGGGVDTVSYAAAGAGVNVNLANSGPQNTGGGGTDTLTNFENLTGSAFNDTLTGDAGSNVIEGGAGDDTIDGGSGVDTATYVSAASAVGVSLAVAGPVYTGGAGVDTLISIENLTGSAFNDTLAGNAGDNVLDGGGGVDTASYAAASAGVNVSLAIAGAQNTGGDGIDTLISIENLTGSAFNDTLTGNAGDNVLTGGGGNDTLDGGDGADVAVFSGLRSDYSIAAQDPGVFLVTDLRAGSPDGADHLTNIEQLRFANGAVNLPPHTQDFNADGASDVLWRNDNGDALLWLGNAGAGPAFGTQAAGNGASWQVAGFGDVDGDGRSDILWRNNDGSAVLWLANAGGGFSAQSLGAPPTSWHLLGVADFNGDGKGDIVWRNDSGQVSVWTANARPQGLSSRSPVSARRPAGICRTWPTSTATAAPIPSGATTTATPASGSPTPTGAFHLRPRGAADQLADPGRGRLQRRRPRRHPLAQHQHRPAERMGNGRRAWPELQLPPVRTRIGRRAFQLAHRAGGRLQRRRPGRHPVAQRRHRPGQRVDHQRRPHHRLHPPRPRSVSVHRMAHPGRLARRVDPAHAARGCCRRS